MTTNKICGIYKITSPTGKIYIGQSVDIYHRVIGYKNGQCRDQPRIYNSIQKHGWNSHVLEIITECPKEDLNKHEIYYIEFYDTVNTPHGLNLKSGGHYGCNLSVESRRKISQKNKGRKLSAETIAKIRFSKLNAPQEERDNLSARMSLLNKGRKWSPEHIKKRSETVRGSKRSEETRQKMKLTWSNRENPNKGKSWSRTKLSLISKKCVQLDQNRNIIALYDSIRSASRHFNNAQIQRCIGGGRKTCRGFIWEYFDPKKHFVENIDPIFVQKKFNQQV